MLDVETEALFESTTYHLMSNTPAPDNPKKSAAFKVTVLKLTAESNGLHFAADPAISVLQAALNAGIELPSSCRNGTCRTCVCTLLSGHITYQIDWPGLSAEEKQAGLILPCVAHPASDLVMRLGY